jgi:hypothetical protein
MSTSVEVEFVAGVGDAKAMYRGAATSKTGRMSLRLSDMAEIAVREMRLGVYSRTHYMCRRWLTRDVAVLVTPPEARQKIFIGL